MAFCMVSTIKANQVLLQECCVYKTLNSKIWFTNGMFIRSLIYYKERFVSLCMGQCFCWNKIYRQFLSQSSKLFLSLSLWVKQVFVPLQVCVFWYVLFGLKFCPSLRTCPFSGSMSSRRANLMLADFLSFFNIRSLGTRDKFFLQKRGNVLIETCFSEKKLVILVRSKKNVFAVP